MKNARNPWLGHGSELRRAVPYYQSRGGQQFSVNVRQRLQRSELASVSPTPYKRRREILMAIPKAKMFSSLMLAVFLLAFSASVGFAQDTTATAGSRTVASGE